MISYLYRDRTVPGSLQRLENIYCLRHCFSLENIIVMFLHDCQENIREKFREKFCEEFFLY